MKQSYDKHSLQLWTKGGYSKELGKSFDPSTKGDFQTPPDVASYMVSLLEGKAKCVLEPTPGKGNIVRALRKAGHVVTSPEDYFLLSRKRKFDAVVMNPPFSSRWVDITHAPAELQKKDIGMRMGYWFLTDCMRRSPTVVALMPWFTITDSDVRFRNLKKWGLKSITALPRRTFRFARIQTMVLHLEKGYKGPTQMILYDMRDDKQTTML